MRPTRMSTIPSTYSLTGADAARFNIDSSGAITFAALPDFENPADADHDNAYQVTVHAIDNGAVHDVTKDLTINVTDANDNAPASPIGDGERVECRKCRRQRRRLRRRATDGDATARQQHHRLLARTAGGDNDFFTIDSATGQVPFHQVSPDFESARPTPITTILLADHVHANDGVPRHPARRHRHASPTLNDNAPIFDSHRYRRRLCRKTRWRRRPSFNGHATDADLTAANNTITYSLTGDDAGQFNISSTGAVTFVTSPDFENPADLNADNVYPSPSTPRTASAPAPMTRPATSPSRSPTSPTWRRPSPPARPAARRKARRPATWSITRPPRRAAASPSSLPAGGNDDDLFSDRPTTGDVDVQRVRRISKRRATPITTTSTGSRFTRRGGFPTAPQVVDDHRHRRRADGDGPAPARPAPSPKATA